MKNLTKVLVKLCISFIYQLLKKNGHITIYKDFFIKLPHYLNKESILILAKKNKNIIAGALNFISNNILYGRYWEAMLI